MYNSYKKTRTLPDVPEISESIHPIKVNFPLLTDILSQRRHSKSPLQDEFLTEVAIKLEEKGATAETDEYGNLYITKGKGPLYPCAVAHVDINQTVRNNVRIYRNDKWIFGFDLDEGVQCGLGADDGVGVYFALEMFDRFENFKIFFAKDEEIGCVGSNRADSSFFSDCSMILQLDRRSYTTDLITYTNGIKTCSPEFVEAASEIMATYTYSENSGIATDIGALKKNELVDCIAVNVACGYINEHSDQEVISVPHLINAINFGYALFKNLGERKWEHVYTPSFTVTKTYSSAGNYGTSHKSSKTWSKNVWGEQEEEDYYDLHGFYGPYSDQYEKKTVNNFAKDDLPKISSMTDAEFEAYMNGPSGFEQDKSTQLSLFGDSSSKGVEKASGLCFTEKEFEEIEAKHVFISDLNNRTVELEFPEVCSTVKARNIQLRDIGFLNKGKITRTNIDYWLRNDYCPECYNAVFVSNSYLLYSYCTECKGLFNVPESDYDFLNSIHQEMIKGEVSEIEFLDCFPVEVDDLVYFLEEAKDDISRISDKKQDNNTSENPFDVN